MFFLSCLGPPECVFSLCASVFWRTSSSWSFGSNLSQHSSGIHSHRTHSTKVTTIEMFVFVIRQYFQFNLNATGIQFYICVSFWNLLFPGDPFAHILVCSWCWFGFGRSSSYLTTFPGLFSQWATKLTQTSVPTGIHPFLDSILSTCGRSW